MSTLTSLPFELHNLILRHVQHASLPHNTFYFPGNIHDCASFAKVPGFIKPDILAPLKLVSKEWYVVVSRYEKYNLALVNKCSKTDVGGYFVKNIHGEMVDVGYPVSVRVGGIEDSGLKYIRNLFLSPIKVVVYQKTSTMNLYAAKLINPLYIPFLKSVTINYKDASKELVLQEYKLTGIEKYSDLVLNLIIMFKQLNTLKVHSPGSLKYVKSLELSVGNAKSSKYELMKSLPNCERLHLYGSVVCNALQHSLSNVSNIRDLGISCVRTSINECAYLSQFSKLTILACKSQDIASLIKNQIPLPSVACLQIIHSSEDAQFQASSKFIPFANLYDLTITFLLGRSRDHLAVLKFCLLLLNHNLNIHKLTISHLYSEAWKKLITPRHQFQQVRSFRLFYGYKDLGLGDPFRFFSRIFPNAEQLEFPMCNKSQINTGGFLKSIVHTHSQLRFIHINYYMKKSASLPAALFSKHQILMRNFCFPGDKLIGNEITTKFAPHTQNKYGYKYPHHRRAIRIEINVEKLRQSTTKYNKNKGKGRSKVVCQLLENLKGEAYIDTSRYEKSKV